MKRLLVCFLAAVLLIAAAAAPSAHADGFTTITCQAPAIKQVDPIKNFSATDPNFPSAHMHSATVQNFTASLTGADIRGRVSSTCNVPADNNIAWWPSPVAPDGSIVSSFTEYRLINDGDPDHADVVAPPDDFTFIAGNAANATESAATQIWRCQAAGAPELRHIPATCPAGTQLIKAAFYNGQGCWDETQGTGPGLGKTSGPADAQSHMVNDLDCDNNTKIFRVSTTLLFDVALAGGHLSCDDHNDDGIFEGDPGSCLHVDFVFEDGKDANGHSFNEAVMTSCLNFDPAGLTSCFVDSNGVFRRMGDAAKTPILSGRATPPPPPEPVPASAVTLYGFDNDAGATHLYKLTDGLPSSSWVAVPNPARVEPAPCDASEKALSRYAKAGKFTYTDDALEKAQLSGGGWAGPSSIGCTVPTGTPASVPLYRVLMPDGDRVLTVSTTERDQLVSQSGVPVTLGNVYPPA